MSNDITTATDLANALNAYTGDDAYNDLSLSDIVIRTSEDQTMHAVDSEVVVYDAPSKTWRVEGRPEPIVSEPRETDTDIDGGLDYDVTIATGLKVTVTVEPDPINGGYRPTGDSPDCWIADFFDLDLSDVEIEELHRVARSTRA